jgi:hypothetical protein
MGIGTFDSSSDSESAVTGTNTAGGFGVTGIANTNHGVHGESKTGRGVVGISQSFVGVTGESTNETGVFGTSATGIGVDGRCVSGSSPGVQGISNTGHGVHGQSQTNHAIHGESASSDGVFGISAQGIGVHGQGGRLAGFFEGHVQVTGDFRGAHVFADEIDVKHDVVLSGGDCAEHFDATPDAICEPGTVMAISNGGALNASTRAYDRKVAGVISGAGSFAPAIRLDHDPSNGDRPLVALVGKVYCKVDAGYGAIEIGDLLTTSETLGHAMKVSDPSKAFGAVIGKALGSLGDGTGLIPILIAMQ